MFLFSRSRRKFVCWFEFMAAQRPRRALNFRIVPPVRRPVSCRVRVGARAPCPVAPSRAIAAGAPYRPPVPAPAGDPETGAGIASSLGTFHAPGSRGWLGGLKLLTGLVNADSTPLLGPAAADSPPESAG